MTTVKINKNNNTTSTKTMIMWTAITITRVGEGVAGTASAQVEGRPRGHQADLQEAVLHLRCGQWGCGHGGLTQLYLHRSDHLLFPDSGKFFTTPPPAFLLRFLPFLMTVGPENVIESPILSHPFKVFCFSKKSTILTMPATLQLHSGAPLGTSPWTLESPWRVSTDLHPRKLPSCQ